MDDLQKQLLDAYIQRDAADERIKFLRAIMAGIQVAEQKAKAEASTAQQSTE